MATMTEAQVVGAELERVTPVVATLYERDSTFYGQIEKRPVEVVSGRDMRVVLDLRPGGKTRQWNSDGGDLGRGGGPTYDKALINTVDLLHAIEWTTKSQWVTDDKRKAVINNFRDLLAKSMGMFRSNTDKLVSVGDGNGTLGTVTTWTQNTPVGFDTITMTTDGFGAHNVRLGCDIQTWNAGLTARRDGGTELEIKYVDIPNKTIRVVTGTLAAVIGGDKIVFSGAAGTPPQSLFGVAYHNNDSSTGTWLGFDRSTTPEIRGNSVDATNNSLAHPQPRLALNKIGDRLGLENRGQKTAAWTHPAQQSAYEEMGFGLVQIFKEAKEEPLDLYFSESMKLAGAPLKVSYNWDRTRIDFCDMDSWGRAELHKPGFYEVEGRKIFEIRSGDGGLNSSFIFYLVASFNTFVKNPAASAYIKNLLVPSGY